MNLKCEVLAECATCIVLEVRACLCPMRKENFRENRMRERRRNVLTHRALGIRIQTRIIGYSVSSSNVSRNTSRRTKENFSIGEPSRRMGRCVRLFFSESRFSSARTNKRTNEKENKYDRKILIHVYIFMYAYLHMCIYSFDKLCRWSIRKQKKKREKKRFDKLHVNFIPYFFDLLPSFDLDKSNHIEVFSRRMCE